MLSAVSYWPYAVPYTSKDMKLSAALKQTATTVTCWLVRIWIMDIMECLMLAVQSKRITGF